jgi:hypothetical protein
MKIQPVQSWQNGQQKEATEFELRIVSDNLSTSAVFYYSLSTAEVNHMETRVITPEIPAWDEPVVGGDPIHHEAIPEVTIEVKVLDSSREALAEGNLTIDGADYQTWDADPSANAWAYKWAASKLNLSLIPGQTFN